MDEVGAPLAVDVVSGFATLRPHQRIVYKILMFKVLHIGDPLKCRFRSAFFLGLGPAG